METNPQPEMEISKEAIECARLESLENSINQGERYLRGQYVQALVNQSTAPLREEIERLKLANSNANGLIGSYADEAKGYANQITQLERQVLGLRDALNICWADSHFLKAEWFDENGHHGVGDVIRNIRKHSELFQSVPSTLASHYTKREVLEKCVEALAVVGRMHTMYDNTVVHIPEDEWELFKSKRKEALTLANEELKTK